MKRPTLYMETTQIAAIKTAAEITEKLVRAGASQISCEYSAQRISGMRFILRVNGHDSLFALPVRTDPVFKIINGRRSYPAGSTEVDRQQAERVAWRQLLRWIEAQLAMIETGMVEPGEVFMPYSVTGDGRTLYQHFIAGTAQRQLAAAAPEGEA